MKCELASYAFEGEAERWWKQLQHRRLLDGEPEIRIWPRMKFMLINDFWPSTCSINCPIRAYNNRLDGKGTHQSPNELPFTMEVTSTSGIYVRQIENGKREKQEFTPTRCSIKAPFEPYLGKQDGNETHSSGSMHIIPKHEDTASIDNEVKSDSHGIAKVHSKEETKAITAPRNTLMQVLGKTKIEELEVVICGPDEGDYLVTEEIEEYDDIEDADAMYEGLSFLFKADYEDDGLHLEQKKTISSYPCFTDGHLAGYEDQLEVKKVKLLSGPIMDTSTSLNYCKNSVCLTYGHYMVSCDSVLELAQLLFDPGGTICPGRSKGSSMSTGISTELVLSLFSCAFKRTYEWDVDRLLRDKETGIMFILCFYLGNLPGRLKASDEPSFQTYSLCDKDGKDPTESVEFALLLFDPGGRVSSPNLGDHLPSNSDMLFENDMPLQPNFIISRNFITSFGGMNIGWNDINFKEIKSHDDAVHHLTWMETKLCHNLSRLVYGLIKVGKMSKATFLLYGVMLNNLQIDEAYTFLSKALHVVHNEVFVVLITDLLPRNRGFNLVIGVLSTADNVKRRMAIKRKWLRYESVWSGPVALRTFVGLLGIQMVSEGLWIETCIYGHIQLMPFVHYSSIITWRALRICIFVICVICKKRYTPDPIVDTCNCFHLSESKAYIPNSSDQNAWQEIESVNGWAYFLKLALKVYEHSFINYGRYEQQLTLYKVIVLLLPTSVDSPYFSVKCQVGFAVYCGNQSRAKCIPPQLHFGGATIPEFAAYYICQSLPIGEVKYDGFGRFLGTEGLRACYLVKSVVEAFMELIYIWIPASM